MLYSIWIYPRFKWNHVEFGMLNWSCLSQNHDILTNNSNVTLYKSNDSAFLWKFLKWKSIWEHSMSQRSQNGQHWIHAKFCSEYNCRVSKGIKHSLNSDHANKVSWLWPSLKDYKDHSKVNIKLVQDMDMENITVEIQKGLSISYNYRTNKISWSSPSLKMRKYNIKLIL